MINNKASKSQVFVKILVMFLVLGLIAILAHYFVEKMPQWDNWLEGQGIWAPIFFIIAFLLLPLIFFPVDPLCFLAGALFGLSFGFLLAGLGMIGSAVLMFLLARYWAQAPVKKWVDRHPKFKNLNQGIERGGMNVLLLLRLAPFPFALLSYFLGVTKIHFRQYFWSIFGTFGTVFVGVYYGSLAKHLTNLVGKHESFTPARDISLFVGLVLCVLAMGAITHYARKNLSNYTEPS